MRIEERGNVLIAQATPGCMWIFACRDVAIVDLKEEKDSDGDPMYQVRLWLRDRRAILLHSQPVHGREWCATGADAIRQFLGITTRD